MPLQDENPYAPPTATVVEQPAVEPDPVGVRTSYQGTERHVQGVGLISICIGLSWLVSSFIEVSQGATPAAPRNGVGLAIAATFLWAGSRLREFRQTGVIPFLVALGVMSVMTVLQTIERPAFLNGTILKLVPAVSMGAVLFAPNVRKVLGREYQSILARTPDIQVRAAVWAYVYAAIVVTLETPWSRLFVNPHAR